MNINIGSSVKGFIRLGAQKKENWCRGIYLGENKVEFWTGFVASLPENKIKEYKRLPRIDQECPDRIKFVNDTWEKLKKTTEECFKRFLPEIQLGIDEYENVIYALGNSVSICPDTTEIETFSSFVEVFAWQICLQVDYPSTRWEPETSDLTNIGCSRNPTTASKLFLDSVWKYHTEGFWQNKFDDELAEELNTNI